MLSLFAPCHCVAQEMKTRLQHDQSEIQALREQAQDKLAEAHKSNQAARCVVLCCTRADSCHTLRSSCNTPCDLAPSRQTTAAAAAKLQEAEAAQAEAVERLRAVEAQYKEASLVREAAEDRRREVEATAAAVQEKVWARRGLLPCAVPLL